MNPKQQKKLKNLVGEDIYIKKDVKSNRYYLQEFSFPKENLEKLAVNCKNWSDISDKELEHICNEIEESTAKSIQLSMRGLNKITQEGIQYLQQAISLNSNSKEFILDFDKCENLNNSYLQQISQSLSINEQVQILQLSFRYCNLITDEGIYYLSQLLSRKKGKLLELNLNFEYSFSLTDESLLYISDSIQDSSLLRCFILNLNSCQISDVGLQSIQKAINSCTNLKQFTLKLELCDKISDVGLGCLSQCLNQNTTLKEFNLFLNSNSEITNEGVKKLFEQLNQQVFNIQSINLSLENLPQISGKVLKYIKNIQIPSGKKLQKLYLVIKLCSNFNQLALENIQALIKEKVNSIEQIVLDFRNQNIFSSNSDPVSCYKKLVDQAKSTNSQVQILYGNYHQLNANNTFLNKSQSEELNAIQKDQQNSSQADQYTLGDSYIFLNSTYSLGLETTPSKEQQSCYIQFSEDKEKKELQVSKLKSIINCNISQEIFQTRLNLERCNQLNVLKDVYTCARTCSQQYKKFDIEIIKNDVNEEYFENSNESNEAQLSSQNSSHEKEILDQTNFSSFFYSIINSLNYNSINFNISHGLVNDKIILSMSKSIKSNQSVKEWQFNFGDCNQITDESLITFFEDLQGQSQNMNSLNIQFWNCIHISDASLQKVNNFIANNNKTLKIELIFSKSNYISDKSLSLLLETIQNDQVLKRTFLISFISCSKPSLKQMVLLDKAIKKKNGEI